jgi:TonB family protein
MNFRGDQGKQASPLAGKDPDFSAFMARLQQMIKRAWYPPRDAQTKTVRVMFKVHTNGELSSLRISRSSGNSVADQAALKAVENAAPFGHLPENSPENVDIEFTFDYNVLHGQ